MNRPRRGRGHRSLPHTADVILEAWGRDRTECLEEIVSALVEQYADRSGASPSGTRRFEVSGTTPEGMLVALLEEVIYLTDTQGLVPVGVSVESGDERTTAGTFRVASVSEVEQVGSVPKAVAWRELELVSGPRGWSCRVTVDV